MKIILLLVLVLFVVMMVSACGNEVGVKFPYIVLGVNSILLNDENIHQELILGDTEELILDIPKNQETMFDKAFGELTQHQINYVNKFKEDTILTTRYSSVFYTLDIKYGGD